MVYILAYLIFGCGVYCGIACTRIGTFKDATPTQILKGWLFGVLLSPVALAITFRQESKRGK